jgi:hypothetical protein
MQPIAAPTAGREPGAEGAAATQGGDVDAAGRLAISGTSPAGFIAAAAIAAILFPTLPHMSSIVTAPIAGQNPGTSGLRKTVCARKTRPAISRLSPISATLI